jgi:hypothetical protein
MREAFKDALLMIYSVGTGVPATADLAPTGVNLARITLASGVCADAEVSTAKQSTVTVTDVTVGHINTIVIAGETFTYTSGGAETVTTVAAILVGKINASLTVPVFATYLAGVITVRSKFPGEDYVITVAGGGGGAGPALTTEDAPAQVRVASLQLIAPVAGVISKEAAVWSKPAIATGTAAYFRLVRTTDDLDNDTDFTDVRLQGTVSTSGADLNMSSINFVSGATQTIDTFTLTVPAAVS